ncbi:MAG TPA: PfkB family carbohydrate kinase, partial [Candidatus Dormibacteraeota bacterium]|nr:PfkB family carbohydrate kinase [Candidatus Dormibacteraeota bacterium]
LPETSRHAGVLFLASMRPSLQRSVREQSNAHTVGLDTMTVYTDTDPSAVSKVAEGADLLFLNRAELRSLTGDADPLRAAKQLCADGARAVIVKAGPDGARVITSDAVIEHQAHPVSMVVDPTGAGDALAGGFLGYCAAAERDDADVFANALSAGLECAAHTITAFGTAGLTSWLDGLH